MEQVMSDLLVFADTWDMHDGGGGWWVVMLLGMLLFWGLVIAGIVWIVRVGAGPRAPDSARSARDVLDERLAAGDMSVEEYERRRDLLSGRRSSSPS
jgi:putative membrane protein